MLKDIEKDLNQEFLSLFIDNLKAIFDYRLDREFMLFNTGTTGWSDAFDKTCDELGKKELKNFYNTLNCDELDFANIEIGQLVLQSKILN